MKKLSKTWILYGIIILSTLIVGEAGFRVVDVLTGNIIFRDLRTYIHSEASTLTHPFLRYTSGKNIRGEWHHIDPGVTFTTTTNSHGFRTHEFYPKLPGRYRVVIMGDSFMYGYNANDNETTAAILEKLLRENISKDIEVYSLGVSSYSGVRYAALARIYFDYLKPDLVIVAVDQSDFKEDENRIKEYILDDNGFPLVLKEFADLVGRDLVGENIAITHDREMVIAAKWKDWTIRLRTASSLFNAAWQFQRYVKTREFLAPKFDADKIPLVRYEDLVKKYGSDISAASHLKMWGNNIPYDLPTSRKNFRVTLKSLQYVKMKCDSIGARMYLSSYPYPWMVRLNQSLAYQASVYTVQLDFRNNRVHTELLDDYARTLGVPHVNSYPVFENDKGNNWGNFDPHFNARGYALYASTLFSSIKDDVKAAMKSQGR